MPKVPESAWQQSMINPANLHQDVFTCLDAVKSDREIKAGEPVFTASKQSQQRKRHKSPLPAETCHSLQVGEDSNRHINHLCHLV
jgi:hypothetical protein